MEMAIVIVVVALIIAAVMSSRTMVHNSQIQSIMGEYQMYASAVKNFKGKYLALPGDYSEATEKWGAIGNSCVPDTTLPTGKQTCNGNGNSLIEVVEKENLLAWRHLGLSGFIQQNFTGAANASRCGGRDLIPGKNAPASKLVGGVWNLMTAIPGTPYTTGSGDQFIPMNACSNNLKIVILTIGGGYQDDNGFSDGCAYSQIPMFTPAEMFAIDTKYDNKRATSGKIRVQFNNTAIYQSCEGGSGQTGGYPTSTDDRICSMAFLVTI